MMSRTLGLSLSGTSGYLAYAGVGAIGAERLSDRPRSTVPCFGLGIPGRQGLHTVARGRSRRRTVWQNHTRGSGALRGAPMSNARQTCAHLSAELRRAGASNGIGLWCADCGRWATKELGLHTGWALPKDHPRLAGIAREKVPTVHPVAVECEICERTTHEPELHHWCPRALYKEMPHEGPTAYLCPDCHRTWHNLVTPGLLPLAALELVRALYRRMRGRPGAWTEFVRTVNDADAKVRRRPPTPIREAA